MKIGYFDMYGDETRSFFSSVSENEEPPLKPVREPSDIKELDYFIVGGAPEDNEYYWNRLQSIINKSYPSTKIVFMNTPSNNKNIKERFRDRKNIKFLEIGKTIKFGG